MTARSLMDERALRARLICAVEGEIEGSPYLLALAACVLSCDPASVGELQMLDAIFRQQCEAEAIEGDHLLDVLGGITEVVS
jgi:hypothetical protein